MYKKTNWNAILTNQKAISLTTKFGLRTLSGRKLIEGMKEANPEGASLLKRLLDTRGTEMSRELSRKSLKVRKILDKRNLSQIAIH